MLKVEVAIDDLSERDEETGDIHFVCPLCLEEVRGAKESDLPGDYLGYRKAMEISMKRGKKGMIFAVCDNCRHVFTVTLPRRFPRRFL